MILVSVVTAPAVEYLRVKAVVVENSDGSNDHFVSGHALARLGIDHPEVLTQLSHP